MSGIKTYKFGRNKIFIILNNIPGYENDTNNFIKTLYNPLNKNSYFYYFSNLNDIKLLEYYIWCIYQRFPASDIIMFISVYGSELNKEVFYLGEYLFPFSALTNAFAKSRPKSQNKVLIFAAVVELNPRMGGTKIDKTLINLYKVPLNVNTSENILLTTIMKNKIFSQDVLYDDMTIDLSLALTEIDQSYAPTKIDFGADGMILIPKLTQ